MNNKRLSHEEVREAVTTHFTKIGFDIDIECDISFGAGKGRNHGIADVVIKNDEGYWIAIVECKKERLKPTLEGETQLKGYLSATDTRFGIIAASKDPANWIYFENLRSNVFIIRERPYFNAHINDRPPVDRPDQDAINKLKTEKEQLETDNNKLKTDNNKLKRKIKLLTISIPVLLIIAGLSIFFLILLPIHTDPQYQVVRIIDGDTVEIKYKGKFTSVQLFGVNAPETDSHPNKSPEPLGEEASKYLQDLLLDESIYLRFDEHRFDQYERIWGYVYRVSDGIFVNLEVIREGFAKVDLRYPFKYKDLFTDYESRAKKDKKGLWGITFR